MENNDFQKDVNNVAENVKPENGKVKKSANKEKRKTVVLIVILLVLMLIIGVLAGIFISGNGKMITDNIEKVTEKKEENKTSKKIDESKPWVYDADYGNNKTVKTIKPWNNEVNPNSKDDLVVPFININSAAGEKANKAIKALYEEMYENYAADGEGISKKGCSLKYKFYENKNILSVVIENSNFVVPGGAGKCPLYIYNFNLETLENATNEELAKQTGYDSISEVEELINEWVAREKTGDEIGGSFVGLVKDTYFIDGSNKLNFVYTVGAAGTYDYAKKVDEVKETKSNNNSKDANQTNNTESQTKDYSVFTSFKGRTYKNEDFNTWANTAKEYCELSFDKEGKPTIKIGYKSDVNSECYFETKDISNLKSEGAAGTTYVTFDFTAWTPGGDTTGNATIGISNVSENYTMTVSAKANFDIGIKEYNNIIVKSVGQNAIEYFVLPEFKNRVYESQDNLTGLWYNLEFDENGKPTITIISSEGENKQIVDKYTRFTDVYSDGAAGTVYINFSYRLLNETGDKVEGYLGYSNNTDNNELRLKLNNTKTEIMVKRVK